VVLLFGAPLDLRLYDGLRLAADSPLAPLAAGLSGIGGFAALGPLALLVVGGLLVARRVGAATWLLLTIASGRLLVELIKLGVHRTRPPAGDRLALVTSYSFPSSHSAGSMLTCLAVAMLFGRPERIIPLAIAMACAIGWSRIALGVHWPSDVLAGLGFGMLWVGLAQLWLNPSRFAAR
jgi:undecaprenyl-diphosphatase